MVFGGTTGSSSADLNYLAQRTKMERSEQLSEVKLLSVEAAGQIKAHSFELAL